MRLKGQLIEAEYKLSTYNVQVSNEIGSLRAKTAELDQQVAASEAHRSIEIRAPGAGVVTAVMAHAGQVVTAGAPLLTIVPERDHLQAELLAPSRSIGFVRAGERVLLRYGAFPYQKFGQYWGTVVDVSHAALPEGEVRSVVSLPNNQPQTDTFYRVTVLPDRPDVNVYGRSEPLQASMRVQASVLLDKRPLISGFSNRSTACIAISALNDGPAGPLWNSRQRSREPDGGPRFCCKVRPLNAAWHASP